MSHPKAKLQAKIKKSPDFELHIRTVKVDGVEVVELRDFIPSEKWYGRGIQFSTGHLSQVIEELKALAKYHGGSADPHSTKEALKQSKAAGVPGLPL